MENKVIIVQHTNIASVLIETNPLDEFIICVGIADWTLEDNGDSTVVQLKLTSLHKGHFYFYYCQYKYVPHAGVAIQL